MTKYLKPGWILGVIAIVFALAGSATASSLITSAKIKDGTIRTRDIRKGAVTRSRLSADVRATLNKAGNPTTVQSSPPQPGPAGPQGPKGDTGPQGPAGPAGSDGAWFPKGFFITNKSVGLTWHGADFGPYGDAGSSGGSVLYTGLNGTKLKDITALKYAVSYQDDDNAPLGMPYLRVFLNDEPSGNPDDVVFDPTECATASPAQNDVAQYDVLKSTKLRYDDDPCGANYQPLSWDQVVADHGDETVTGIMVTTGFAGGHNVEAWLHDLTANAKTFHFGD
jgi:hypothetical protein